MNYWCSDLLLTCCLLETEDCRLETEDCHLKFHKKTKILHKDNKQNPMSKIQNIVLNKETDQHLTGVPSLFSQNAINIHMKINYFLKLRRP